MNVTLENFQDVLETSLFASVSLQNYNSECFGMRDLFMARASHQLLVEIVDGVVASGNNPYTLIQPTFQKFGYDLSEHYKPEDYASIKEPVPLSLDLEGYSSILAVGEHVKKDSPDLAEFLSSKKFR